MHVCNNFKHQPRGWDQPEKTNVKTHMKHRLDLKCLNIADNIYHTYTEFFIESYMFYCCILTTF